MLFLRPLLVAILVMGTSAQARVCLAMLSASYRETTFVRVKFGLTAEQEATFVSWLNRHKFYIERPASLSEEQLGLVLAELPEEVLPKVMRLTSEMEPYFRARRSTLGFYPVYARTLDYYTDDRVPRIRLANARIARYRALGDAEKQAVARHYDAIREVGRVKEKLTEVEQPAYRLRFDSEWVTFPDGARYRYEKLLWGQRRIWVRFKNIVRTQTHLYPDTLTRYRNQEDPIGTGLREIMGPDGRVLLYDGHHRVTAYAMRRHREGDLGDVRVPFLLRRSADGYYYSVPHFRILFSANYVDLPSTRPRWEHDLAWSFLQGEERRTFLKNAWENPLETFREPYYRETGLPKLGDEN